MLIALLAVLGVDLIVVVALLGFVLSRKRWVKRQPGAFRGAIRVTGGEIDGLRPKWSRGYGRWVGTVLVWTKGPLLFRNELVETDGADEQRPADAHEVKRLGDRPTVAIVSVGDATAEVAACHEDRELVLGPYRNPDEAVLAAHGMPVGQR